MTFKSFVFLLLAGVAFGAQAELDVQQQGAVSYVAGGVGIGEREVLQGMRSDFNVRLTFAVKGTGAYVADVDVTISDMNGAEVLKTLVPAPKLFAQLAPGRYTVKAVYAGRTQTQRVSVGQSGARELIFYWDDPSAREGRDWEPEPRARAPMTRG